MEKWVVAAKRADFQKIAETFHIDPVTARLIRNRDIETMDEIEQYLHGTLADIPSPWLLKGMKESVEILKKKLTSGAHIRIIGDYDIDGVTATYILLKAFLELGSKLKDTYPDLTTDTESDTYTEPAAIKKTDTHPEISEIKGPDVHVDTYIPNRITDGYGIHEHLIESALRDGVDTIVTCDNGIAAYDEIRNAKEKGLTVIVTDHHEIPYKETGAEKIYILPPADAIINPKQPDCPYPNKNICGAVVAWKLVTALYESCGLIYGQEVQTDVHKSNEKRPLPKAQEEFLEFAAIATVGDVMDLQGENRIIVKEGLKRLPYTKNIGLQALIRATGLEEKAITAYHIGFVMGPCINASGRLDTAFRALKLFRETDPAKAAALAGDLKALNDSRKDLTEKGREEAVRIVEETGVGKDRVLVIFLPDCHESLAGIIAGRIREQFHRPAFVLTRGEQLVKGSGRSIEAYSMYEELTKCSDLLEAFGGHPMAAGLSLKEENVEAFRRKMNEYCTLGAEELTPKITIDVPMPIGYVRRDLIEELKLLEPFGKGNTRPLFAQKDLQVIDGRIFGKNQNVAKCRIMDAQGNCMDAVYFGDAAAFLEYAHRKGQIFAAYYPEIDSYNGREKIQAVIRHYC